MDTDTQNDTENTGGKGVASSDMLDDLRRAMLQLELDKGGIKNDGSFAMTILWRMYEDAEEYLEDWRSWALISDEVIEESLKFLFPDFIRGYPQVMSLSNKLKV